MTFHTFAFFACFVILILPWQLICLVALLKAAKLGDLMISAQTKHVPARDDRTPDHNQAGADRGNDCASLTYRCSVCGVPWTPECLDLYKCDRCFLTDYASPTPTAGVLKSSGVPDRSSPPAPLGSLLSTIKKIWLSGING